MMKFQKKATFIASILLVEYVLADEERRTCQSSMRVALQNIFEEFENNNTVCTVEDLRQTLSPIFDEMLDQRETQIISRIEERYGLVAQLMETVKDISNVRLFFYIHIPPGLGVTGPPRDGLPGPVGPIGPKGSGGQTGRNGRYGLPGEKGFTGEIGPAGLEGPIGPKGTDGQTGPSGIDGRDGLSGVSGTPGAPGPKGDQGPTGQPGTLGPKGPNGEPGPKGNDGPRGPSGEPGPKGDQGTQNIGEIAFAAYNDNSRYPQNTFLSFNEVPENIGGAFNRNAGVFTFPRTGTYIFGFTAEVYENPTHCYITV